ncbi:hypothetical protein GCM10009801_73310 [Streptomyces albiaxialis]|uniref:Uncharacterized protein n=1 Tax=Streptomyces albiaxialis TaxID=329523 RepID=A0ABN2WXB9_9ACTN
MTTQHTGAPTTDPHLAPHLPPTPRNLESAVRAVARITEDAWLPLVGYPGSDVHWRVRCLLCGWEGERFYSHLRRGRPAFRHPDCLPLEEQQGALDAYRTARSPECVCLFAHPTTPAAVREVRSAIDYARRVGDLHGLMIHLVRLLGPCPAAPARAEAFRAEAAQPTR